MVVHAYVGKINTLYIESYVNSLKITHNKQHVCFGNFAHQS